MTPNFFRSAIIAAIALAPAAAFAQYIVPEPTVIPEPAIVVEPPAIVVAPAGPLSEEDAADIAMMNGIAVVEDVDYRIWDGNFEVEGTDATGEDLMITIDHDTGAVLDIDS
jgi:hypothetical protein